MPQEQEGQDEKTNLEYHYETIGRILAFLVEKGLRRIDLDESNAMEIMTERWGSEEEVTATFADSLYWMYSEGLIHVGKISFDFSYSYNFNGVQLSSKGIAVIKQNPNDPSLGGSIEKKLKENSGDLDPSVYQKIGSFVGGVLGGFTQSISGA